MAVIRKAALWLGGAVAVLAIFWVVDLPQTVRLKAAIVRMLPLDPGFMDSTIRNLCAGAHSGSAITDCYMAFYGEEAAKAVADRQEQKMICQQLVKRLEAGLEKDWYRREPMTKEEIRETATKWARLGGKGDEAPDPDLERSLTENNVLRYEYLGNDPELRKDGPLSFYPNNCEFRSLTHRRYLK
jgi:hypothetical protein